MEDFAETSNRDKTIGRFKQINMETFRRGRLKWWKN